MTVAYVVVVAPVLGQMFRKFRSPWRPTGDDAIFAINAHDVFSWRPPLLGTYSVVARVGNETPPLVYHLGPMVSWVLAIPERFFGQRLGVAYGAAIVNTAMLFAAVWVVRRVFDERAALVAAIAIALMAWSVGHSTLAEPWNPYIGLWALPLICALACGVAVGVRWALAWLVVVASFAVQAHYLYLAIAALVALACIVVALTRTRVAPTERLSVGSLRWTLIALVVCWTPTLLQQMFGDPGNLLSWFRATTRATESKSGFLDFSFRYVVNSFAAPGLAVRGPLNPLEQLDLTYSPSTFGWVSAGAAAAFVVFMAVYFRSSRPSLAAFATVTVVVAIATTFTLSQLPASVLAFPYYRIVMLWFASTLLWACVVSGAFCLANSVRKVPSSVLVSEVVSKPRSLRSGFAGALTPTLIAVALAVAVLAVVSTSPEGPVDRIGAEATGVMSDQGRRLLDPGRRYEVVGSGARGVFAAYGVFRDLHNAGFDVYVPNDEVQLRRNYAVGSRDVDTLIVHSGAEALPANAILIASFDGRSPADLRRYELLSRGALNGDSSAATAFEQERFGIEQLQFRMYVLKK